MLNSLIQWNTQCSRGKQQNGYRQEHCSKLKGIKPLVSAGEIHGCWPSFKHLEAMTLIFVDVELLGTDAIP